MRHLTTPQSSQYNPMGASGRPGVNAADNSLDLAPFTLYESGHRRGRLRGLYHVCTYWSNVFTGMTFNGSGDYAGKTFQIISEVMNETAVAVETSNTVETN
jgi:hypothetical protein